MRRTRKIKSKLIMVLFASLSSSIFLSSCSSVITDNITPPIINYDLKILNNKINTNKIVNDKDFDIFLKNIVEEIENEYFKIVPDIEIANFEILDFICKSLNGNKLIKFDLESIDYSFVLESDNFYPNNKYNNNYKIILSIKHFGNINSIDFFGNKLKKIDDNKFLFFENKNKEIGDNYRFSLETIREMEIQDFIYSTSISSSTRYRDATYLSGWDSNLYAVIKHLLEMGIYDLRHIHNDGIQWRLGLRNQNKKENVYNIENIAYTDIYGMNDDERQIAVDENNRINADNNSYHYLYYNFKSRHIDKFNEYVKANNIPLNSFSIFQYTRDDYNLFKIALKTIPFRYA